VLKVAGWSSVKTIAGSSRGIGAIFGLFLSATTTKDFADMEGDRGGCLLPISRRPPRR
jgi:hypothetical protein